MFKILRKTLYIVALLFIGGSVFIATLPHKVSYQHNISFNDVPKKMIQNQLIHFENWKNWAVADTGNITFQKNNDPLLSKLMKNSPKKSSFSIENELVLDSILIQKVYSKSEQTIQSLTWELGRKKTVNKILFTLNEELSIKDKLYELFKWKNDKRLWLQDLHNRIPLLQQQLNKRASDYSLTYSGKENFGPFHYVYMSGSGHVNNINEQTKKHIAELEQYLAEHEVNNSNSPITIYNNYDDLTGNLIFSTAIPINTEILIPNEIAIRYGKLDTISVYKMNITGNPKSTKALWDTFKKRKETTLNPMSTLRFEIHKLNESSIDDYTQWKKQLVWGIKEITLTEKDSTYKSISSK